ncbi:MBL fold metallo-hydrolase [Microbacterium sediminis]|uniref:MBL fold metallo-hydrolase n=1 Tax=Microbacterium sediminis TaxID=904291 RepID=A0A1B9NFF0_9MICO|nr:MBL fold metallo-hydrolase [Microbacterium sediminis]OCG75328.1 MBL fold metallo-hydrolase [Microbacterium sediminis]QBR74349.1 MBL fold metallo-hydrolase [Microbacterium sediminis]
MRVTKHEHATLRLHDQGDTLVVDPGSFTTPLDALHDLVGVVITHEHRDHWTPAQLDHLAQVAPRVPIYAPQGVADAAEGYDITVVAPGDTVTVGAFTLRFFGGVHAQIHESIPLVDNVGVMINDRLYYPGDSFAVPDAKVPVLAAPIGAPWLKLGEAMDFVLAVAPERAFPTHDMTLSVSARTMHASRLAWAAEQNGGELVDLAPGDELDV